MKIKIGGNKPTTDPACTKLHFGKATQKAIKVSAKKAEPSKRNILFGTGLTKKLLQSAGKDMKKSEATKTSKLTVDPAKPNAERTAGIPDAEGEAFKVGELPSTLMDANIVLDEYQSAALQGLRNQKYGCLIGAAGTGKTTALKALIAEVEDAVPVVDVNTARVESDKRDAPDMHVAVCFCSFTGRAVQQMKRALPEKYHGLANTIHMTLGYKPTVEERTNDDPESDEYGMTKEVRVFRPTFTSFNKLPYKICIVDEAGTVPINLWDELIAALPSDCRVFLIGDLNQLPPVQGRSVLGFAMLKWPTYTLEQLHRLAEGDPIAENAHRVLQGMKPMTDEVTKKFIVKKIGDGSLSARKETLMVVQHLHKQGVFDPMTDALIVPQNISAIGQIELNQQLVNYFNPPQYDDENEVLNPRTIITAGYAHAVFAAGDKVMLLANDNKLGLTNGMVGMVESIIPNASFKGESVASTASVDLDGDFDLADMTDELMKYATEDEDDSEDESERAASHVMTVRFQNVKNEVTFATAGEFKKISHAYASTCHKSQGGEYPTVVILAHSANLKMLTREWLYTAITRAKKRVVLLTNHRGLTHAVNNQRIKGKTIADKAQNFLKLQDKSDTRLPNLPEPQEIKYEKIEIVE